MQEAVDRQMHVGQYVGALVILPLLHRKDSKTCAIIEGRLHIPLLINLLGENSFDYPFSAP